MLDSLADLDVGVAEVIGRLLGLLGDVLDDVALLDDLLVQELEEVEKLRDGALNLEHVIMAGADVAEDCGGLA